MQGTLSKIVMAAGAAAALATSAIPKPASADTTSTLNTLLGAAAVIGGIVIYNNVQHKNAQANQIVGYTRNGGTVYGDGRIVMPNGQTYYPNASGQNAINQGGYNNGYNPQTYGYNNGQYTGGYNPGQNSGGYNPGQNSGGYNNGQYSGGYNPGQYGSQDVSNRDRDRDSRRDRRGH